MLITGYNRLLNLPECPANAALMEMTRKEKIHGFEKKELLMMENITPNRIDDIISAKIPDIEIDKDLHDIVSKNMIHDPCGSLNNNSLCMSDGKCTKRYPRDLLAETLTGNVGYPLYRR
ncbi:helitron_like_N domain-containing protein [Trichonephila clavata]|uniref:Helitron_like_N domain-containing protein n=1 Tax=Trichonephila clavata TaxID=2740835 RepID=A0A8X6F339_TRICU|nr:helitron_like_N domain-containing protein [Trichonephila clavata]